MSLPDQPQWACSEWGPAHNWHDCNECLEQYELMIERSQGGWDDDPLEHGEELEHAQESVFWPKASR